MHNVVKTLHVLTQHQQYGDCSGRVKLRKIAKLQGGNSKSFASFLYIDKHTYSPINGQKCGTHLQNAMHSFIRHCRIQAEYVYTLDVSSFSSSAKTHLRCLMDSCRASSVVYVCLTEKDMISTRRSQESWALRSSPAISTDEWMNICKEGGRVGWGTYFFIQRGVRQFTRPEPFLKTCAPAVWKRWVVMMMMMRQRLEEEMSRTELCGVN